MIKVVVVDDHTIVRKGLCRFISDQHDMEVVANVATGQAAIGLLNDGLDAHVVLTDLNMPEMDGLELTRQAIALQERLRVIVLTFHTQSVLKQRALAAGATECLSKDGDPDDLLKAIRTVYAA